MGSVVLQVGALELLARYSMNSGRATSLLSSLHEFRMQEVELAHGKQWNWKYLRVSYRAKIIVLDPNNPYINLYMVVGILTGDL